METTIIPKKKLASVVNNYKAIIDEHEKNNLDITLEGRSVREGRLLMVILNALGMTKVGEDKNIPSPDPKQPGMCYVRKLQGGGTLLVSRTGFAHEQRASDRYKYKMDARTKVLVDAARKEIEAAIVMA